ncbi:hypothetical protein MSG28_014511 [Choristoneura fumiferana]|uniref:Uncharacterized protein n=2 Tax=Choristoneura fumiferana TaxID=7141 RepID=A0ACC0JRQ8_CHOFU|nr:hypothetical protein MSG28_014511 [Choristoneura fumiferana]
MQADWNNHFADSMNKSFRRPGWSLALCWMIFACAHGYGGPVNWFLSLGLWKFVARISYAMYLFHTLLQDINIAAVVTPIYFNMGTLFFSFASDLGYTVVFSTAMCILIEEPALTLQKKLLTGYFEQDKKTENEHKPTSVSEQHEEK